MMPAHRLKPLLRRFLRAEDGSESVQFMLVIPLLAGLLFIALSSGIATVNASLLDRAVDRTARDLRYGTLTDRSVAGLRTRLCTDLAGMSNCASQLKVQLVRIARTAGSVTLPSDCTDQSASFEPVTSLLADNQNSYLLLRACLPVTALAANLPASPATETGTPATRSTFFVSAQTMIAVR